jgi:hypothetical protein
MANQYMISSLSVYSFDKYIEEIYHLQRFHNIYPKDTDERIVFLRMVFDWMQKPICFAPLELSERQKRQQGAFFIFPNVTKEDEFGRYFSDDIDP